MIGVVALRCQISRDGTGTRQTVSASWVCPLSSPLSDVAGSGSRAYFELVVTCIGAMEDAATFRDSYGALSIAISAKRVEVGLLQRFRSICNCFREFPEASAIELESVVSNCQDDANLLLFSMS